MIKSKELLQLIKDTTLKLAGFEAQMSFKVYNDEELKISGKEVGGKVELIGTDGELLPVEDGDYEMTDGLKFTVKDGQISTIEGQKEKPSEEEAPQPEEEIAPETPVEEAPQESGELHGLTEKVSALEQTVASLQAALDELRGGAAKEDVADFNTQISELKTVIEKLAGMPAEFSKTNTNPLVKDAGDKKKMELGAIIADVMKK